MSRGDISVISPLIEGKVATVAVGDNQAVKTGDVLVTIENDDFQAKVAEAEASAAAADASIGTIDSQIIWQQTKIDQIVAQQRSAAAELTRAKTVYDRYKKLIESRVIGTQDLDEATASYVKSQAAVSETSAQLAAEQTQLGVYKASRKEGEAKQMEAVATLKLAQINLDRTVIRAPIDGVVGNRGVRVGQYVKAGTQMLSLVPTDVHVVANFKETQLDRMRPRPAGRDLGRRLLQREADRHDRKLRARERRRVQPAARGERHRQLHQDRAPRAGADRAAGEQSAARTAAAGPLGRGRCRYTHRAGGERRRRQGAEDRRGAACCSGPRLPPSRNSGLSESTSGCAQAAARPSPCPSPAPSAEGRHSSAGERERCCVSLSHALSASDRLHSLSRRERVGVRVLTRRETYQDPTP